MPMSAAHVEALRELLTATRVLSLALIVDDAPVIGLLPFAATPDFRALVVHASQLARHTKGLLDGAGFDALLHEPVLEDVDPLQVKRVTLRGVVRVPERGTPAHDALRRVYLMRHPEAEPITALGDFAFYVLVIEGGRLVTGFGAAANVTPDALATLGE
jgi:heme iron utilization protein